MQSTAHHLKVCTPVDTEVQGIRELNPEELRSALPVCSPETMSRPEPGRSAPGGAHSISLVARATVTSVRGQQSTNPEE